MERIEGSYMKNKILWEPRTDLRRDRPVYSQIKDDAEKILPKNLPEYERHWFMAGVLIGSRLSVKGVAKENNRNKRK
jgi:hypothetical protein